MAAGFHTLRRLRVLHQPTCAWIHITRRAKGSLRTNLRMNLNMYGSGGLHGYRCRASKTYPSERTAVIMSGGSCGGPQENGVTSSSRCPKSLMEEEASIDMKSLMDEEASKASASPPRLELGLVSDVRTLNLTQPSHNERTLSARETLGVRKVSINTHAARSWLDQIEERHATERRQRTFVSTKEVYPTD
jgi:hypothetical protein